MTQDIHSGPGDLAPGEQLAGYEIQQRIGRGGMAVVYRALDLRLGRLVALKVLAPHLGEDEAFRQRFMRESRAAAGVDHPHIVPVFEAGEANGVLFIAMRYVSNGDVRSLIEAEGRLSPDRTARITSQVASALDAAHAHGLVHRDVKPANILLGQASGSDLDHAYLSDFGLSKHSLTSSTLTSTGQFLGTLDYVSPEQIQGHPVDGRADQYALACAVVEMLTSAPPFRRDDSMALMWAQLEAAPPKLTERRPELPGAVDDVIGAAMSKSPGGRFATCQEFAAALATAFAQGTAFEQPKARWPGPTPTVLSEPVLADEFSTDPFLRRSAQTDRYAAEPFPASARQAGQVDQAGQVGQVDQAGQAGPAGRYAAEGPQASPSGRRQPTRDPWSEAPGAWFRGASNEQAEAPERTVGAGWRASEDRVGSAGPDPAEPFRQPSVHAAWPATPAPARRDGAAPGPRPQQPGRRQAGDQPGQHRARNVVLALLIAIVALGGITGIAYKLAHRNDRSLPPVTVYKTVQPPGDLSPAQVVREYFAAINHRRYLDAWRLSGASEPYVVFRSGFAGTAHDTVTIVSVSGDVVTARLAAVQLDGTVKRYEGTYTVTNGVITATNVQRVS